MLLWKFMAVGLPCISTSCPCGGPKELIDGNKKWFTRRK